MADSEKLAFLSLQPHLRNLRRFGFYQLDPTSTRRGVFLAHQVYMHLSLTLPVVFMMQEIAYVCQVNSDIDKVMDAMFLLLTFINYLYKQVVFRLRADKIETMLHVMKGPLFNQDDAWHRRLLRDNVRQARVRLVLLNGLTQVTVVLWTVAPLVGFFNGDVTDFAIWLPFDASKSPHFFYVLGYVWLQTAVVGFNESTMDAFITFTLVQCTVQIRILRHDLESLVESSAAKAPADGVPRSQALHESLAKCLRHHEQINKLAESVMEVYSGAIFCQFFNTGWINCATMYRAVNMEPLSLEFGSMLGYQGCILVQMFMYCIYGTDLTYESEQLTNSVYNMDWLNTPTEHRRSLVIFMERLKRPIQPVAAASFVVFSVCVLKYNEGLNDLQ